MYTVYMTRKWKQYIGNPSERIRFEKIPRVHYNRNGGFLREKMFGRITMKKRKKS